jgi:hypothetical protein
MATKTKEELQKIIAAGFEAREELRAIEDAEKTKANASLIGKCFKYRNSYSCPESDADYWWLYSKVVSVDGEWAQVLRFQTDRNGRVEFETCSTHVRHLDQQIRSMEFHSQFTAAVGRVTAMYDNAAANI